MDIPFFINVISIKKSSEHLHFVYDTEGCLFTESHQKKAKYKLCKVKIFMGTLLLTMVRLFAILIKVRNTIQITLETGKIADLITFDTGNLCVVTWDILM